MTADSALARVYVAGPPAPQHARRPRRPDRSAPAAVLDVLTRLAAGATDEVITQRRQTSRPTVVRHAASLLERLGATTRVQAGVQASRPAWL